MDRNELLKELQLLEEVDLIDQFSGRIYPCIIMPEDGLVHYLPEEMKKYIPVPATEDQVTKFITSVGDRVLIIEPPGEECIPIPAENKSEIGVH